MATPTITVPPTPSNTTWLVCDMDGTLLPTPTKAKGFYKPVNESPCFAPLKRWLLSGRSLLVITTASYRMFRQMYAPLEETLKAAPPTANFLMSGYGGAMLYVYDHDTHTLKEDEEYREKMKTAFDPTVQDKVENLCLEIVHSFFTQAYEDRSLVSLLSNKYQSVYLPLMDKYSLSQLLSEQFTLPRAKKHGLFLSATHDALVDLQYLLPENPTDNTPSSVVFRKGNENMVLNMTVLGIPMARFRQFFPPEIEQKFQEMGLDVHSQPNSVALSRRGICKQAALEYILKNDKYKASLFLEKAIAFGDSPMGPDGPLAKHPPMPFVCVYAKPHSECIDNSICVGGEEEGSAVYLNKLLEACGVE